MSELLVYGQLGFRHIVSPDAVDHLLFLLVLAAGYRVRDWRAVLLVMSAFTVGHSVTLALVVTGRLHWSPSIIETLIPATIVLTALENVRRPLRAIADRPMARGTVAAVRAPRGRPLIAGLFGLIHGAGFAGYLQAMLVGDVVRPLLGFNLGIELGQAVVLVLLGLLTMAVEGTLSVMRSEHARRWRTVLLSVAAMSVAGGMMWERLA